MTHRQAFTQVDAFTDRPFAGNPAAVCVLPIPRGEEWMQLVAREMNLAETAFLVRRSDGFDLRWFTPLCEVDLCGHATLASAHVLLEQARMAGRFVRTGGLPLDLGKLYRRHAGPGFSLGQGRRLLLRETT